MINLKRILIIGANGHLGGYLSKRWNCIEWKEPMQDLAYKTLIELNPVAVVNASRKTDLKWCEENPLGAFKNNVEYQLHVFRQVKRAFGCSIPYVSMSSGCLWDGPYNIHGHPFYPDEPPNPQCFYAWTKAACDSIMLQESSISMPLLILRPRQLYSSINHPRNTLVKLSKYAKLLDTDNSMTSVSTLVKTLERIFETGHDACWNRIMHVYDLGITSPFKVAEVLYKYGVRKTKPLLLTKSDLDLWHKPKRVDVVMRDGFFEDLVKPNSIEDELDYHAKDLLLAIEREKLKS